MPTRRPDAANGRAAAATIADVARRAGVSRQTVSNVVNRTGRLGEQTRARVLAAIDELGFTPHRGAASLRSGRAHRLAYLLPEGEPREENTILLDFLQHLVDAAADRGQQVLVIRSGSHGGAPSAELDALVRSRSVDAVVLSAVAESDPRVLHLQRLGVPFVCFGRTGPGDPQCWVDVDNEGGLRQATAAVIEHGHTAIAFVGYESSRRWDRAREAGYSAAMAEAGLRRRVTIVDAEHPVRAISRLLRSAHRPTALVTGSDVLAASCYAAAHRAGLVVGRDVAVVGFDGTLAARLLAPSLATVAIPLDRIARAILARLTGEAPNDAGEVLTPRLLAGESLTRWSGSDPR